MSTTTYDSNVRWLLVAAVLGCGSSESAPEAERKPEPESRATSRPAVVERKPVPKPPDEMDERMRHCPIALEGAATTLVDIPGGIRFIVKAHSASLDKARERAKHVIEFAAKRTREGHGEFGGKGGGRMRNCPVVTDDVSITISEVAGGIQLDVISQQDDAGALRAECRARAGRFDFDGATITEAARQ